MIRPLIIARPYLQSYTNGIVERDFFESLPKDRFAPIIIASDRNRISFNSNHIVRCTHEIVPMYNILSALGHIGFNDVVYQPDQLWYPWGRGATRLALQLVKNDSIDYVHTISMDYVNHIIGLQIKEKTKKTWVAQFLEPWSDNPFKKYKTSWGRKRFELYESYIANNADLILHTNKIIADRWIQRYGSEVRRKIEVLPMVVNSTKFSSPCLRNDDRIVITHVGHFYGSRNGISFLKSISTLLLEHPEYQNQFLVNFIGKVTEQETNMIDKLKLSDVVKVLGVLGEEESNIFLCQSDILLVIDPSDGDGLFFPSKLIKYFYAQKPIIGITRSGSVTDYELRKSNNYSFDFDDINGIALFLYNAINDYGAICKYDSEYWRLFSKERIILDYEYMINNILRK